MDEALALEATHDDSAASIQWVWLGNQWVTAQPYAAHSGLGSTFGGGPRNQDLLYWSLLSFNSSNNLQQFVRTDNITLNLP